MWAFVPSFHEGLETPKSLLTAPARSELIPGTAVSTFSDSPLVGEGILLE